MYGGEEGMKYWKITLQVDAKATRGASSRAMSDMYDQLLFPTLKFNRTLNIRYPVKSEKDLSEAATEVGLWESAHPILAPNLVPPQRNAPPTNNR